MTAKAKRKKKMSPAKRNLYVDIGLLGVFLVTLAPDLTGLTIHEWLGYALGGAILTHLILHWKWLVATTKRFFGKMNRQQRINYAMTFALLGAFLGTGLTGLLMSDTLGLGIGGDLLEDVHEAGANVSMLLVGGHLVLHTKWLWNNAKRYLIPKPVIKALEPALAPVRINKRK